MFQISMYNAYYLVLYSKKTFLEKVECELSLEG
jgi:hypothetical protein